MFRNILVSIDSSTHSERALQEAIDIATAGHGRMTLLTAVTQPASWMANPATGAVAAGLAEELEHEAEALLRRATALVPESVAVTTILSHKPIRTALTEELARQPYDLLVLGSRGRGALAASLLGSVSHHALNHAVIPILVVHAEDLPTVHAAASGMAVAAAPPPAA
jgi:nucleotide-binding universal stress UspA family protein